MPKGRDNGVVRAQVIAGVRVRFSDYVITSCGSFSCTILAIFSRIRKKGKFKQEKGTQIRSKLDDPLLE